MRLVHSHDYMGRQGVQNPPDFKSAPVTRLILIINN